jgi:hypothetical protein
MSRVVSPGSQFSCSIQLADGRRFDLTLVDTKNFQWPQKVRERIDASHALTPYYVDKYLPGMMTATFLTNIAQGMAWMQDIVNAKITMNGANRRQIIIADLTLATADGVQENTTDGKTNELTFHFSLATDRDV